MTLSTCIYVKDPIPPEALFRFGQSLLAPAEVEQVWEHRKPGERFSWLTEVNSEPAWPADPNGEWANRLGQGLPAIFEVFYGADGPLVEPSYVGETPDPHKGGCVKVLLDTAYGYKKGRAHCGDLHAWLVQEIGQWLEDRNACYEWQDEHSGKWYSSVDDMRPLGDPVEGRLPHMATSYG